MSFYYEFSFRYRWSLAKVIDFLRYRKPDLYLRPGIHNQLEAFENKMKKNENGILTTTWKGI